MNESGQEAGWFESEVIPDTDVEMVHVMPETFPVGKRRGYVTFLFCTDEAHPQGVIIYAGSETGEKLGHQGLLELAQEVEAVADEAEGHWGGHIYLRNWDLTESRGFRGERDERLYEDFVDAIEKRIQRRGVRAV